MRAWLPVVLTIPLLCAAATPEPRDGFSGDWVADLDTQAGLSTDVYLVANGRYTCRSCVPPRDYPADGRLRPVAGAPDTAEAVTVAGPRSIVTRIASPPLDRTTTMTVSADGDSALYVSLDRRPGIGHLLRTEYLARRTAASPAGAHPVSGTWQGVRYALVPPEVRTTSLRVSGKAFAYSTPLGTAFNARIGGGPVPMRTVAGGNYAAAVRMLSSRVIEERVSLNGRLVLTRRFTLSPDGQSLEIATADADGGEPFRVTARRCAASNGPDQ